MSRAPTDGPPAPAPAGAAPMVHADRGAVAAGSFHHTETPPKRCYPVEMIPRWNNALLVAARTLRGTARQVERQVRARWRAVGVVGSLLAFAVTSLVMWYSFDQTLESTERIAAVTLARDLRKEFRETAVCQPVMDAVNNCAPVYQSNGGPLNAARINDCLNFLDELGQYVATGVLGEQIVDHLFGGAVIEIVYYPELRRYIADGSRAEPSALGNLQALAERLRRAPHRDAFARQVESACSTPVEADSR